ncbi:MAG: FecR domain-containing protein [Pseudomonadota bacterium]
MAADPSHSGLFDEALKLAEASRTGEARAQQAVDAFRQASPRHAEALRRAEAMLDALPRLRPASLKPLQRAQLKLEILWARLVERPQAVGLALVAAIGVGITLLVLPPADRGDETAPVATRTAAQEVAYATPHGRHREVRLDDGTVVWLDWSSALTVRMTPALRAIELTAGRAAFAVAPDPDRPLEVTARGVRTRVTGTEFVVSARDERVIDVAVLEGSVVVTAAAGDVAALSAGQAVQCTGDALSEATERSTEEIGRWRNGLLVVRGKTLTETIAILEPYTSFDIDLARLSDPGPRISATFVVDRADDALAGLIESYRLRVQQAPPNALVLRDPLPARAR